MNIMLSIKFVILLPSSPLVLLLAKVRCPICLCGKSVSHLWQVLPHCVIDLFPLYSFPKTVVVHSASSSEEETQRQSYFLFETHRKESTLLVPQSKTCLIFFLCSCWNWSPITENDHKWAWYYEIAWKADIEIYKTIFSPCTKTTCQIISSCCTQKGHIDTKVYQILIVRSPSKITPL